jgi:hypothetical protein
MNPLVESPEIRDVPDVGTMTKEPAVLTFRRPDELLAMQFDDSDNLMGDRLLCKSGRLAIMGQGGIGKSFLQLQLAAAAITGRDFLSFQTRGRGLRWLVFQAENSNRRLRFDMLQLRNWVGDTDWPLVCENLFIHTLECETDFWLHIATDSAAFERAREAVKRLNPHLVGFDPLKDLTTDDLNKDVDMRAVCDAMSAIARADGNTERGIVVSHHSLTGVQGAEKAVGMDRASFGRNSKVLHAWSRSVINLTAANEDNSLLVVSSGKNNNGAEFKPFAIRRDAATLIFSPEPSFDLEQWRSRRGKCTQVRPTSEQVLGLFEQNERHPRLALLTAVQLRAQFDARGWDRTAAPAIRDQLVAEGKLAMYHGLHNSKLTGLPEMVGAYTKQESERGTLSEQTTLPTANKREFRR